MKHAVHLGAVALAVSAAVLAVFVISGRSTRVGEPALAPQASAPPAPVLVKPATATEPVADDPDDPAIWVNPSDRGRSLVIGTNKVAAPSGALVVFGLDGKTRQVVSGLDRPNNVDVEYGLVIGGRPVDIAVVTERLQRRLRVFRIEADGNPLVDISSLDQLRVFTDRSGEAGEPMGIALYRRPRDGAIFAVLSSKTGPREGYLQQYRLEDDGAGRVKATWARTFGRWSGTNEIEAVAVADALGYVYYSDEGDGIHKYHADPDHPEAARELAHFGTTGFAFDREGIAIHATSATAGYIVCADQIDGNSQYHVYRREGAPGNAHDHSELVSVFAGGADACDGIEITSVPLPRYDGGLMVAMNSARRNFLLYRWADVAAALNGR